MKEERAILWMGTVESGGTLKKSTGNVLMPGNVVGSGHFLESLKVKRWKGQRGEKSTSLLGLAKRVFKNSVWEARHSKSRIIFSGWGDVR